MLSDVNKRLHFLILWNLLSAAFLLFPSYSFAADTYLCSDDDNNGVVDIYKAVGKVDRDCDGEASVADGGHDCDDLDAHIRNGTYTYAAYEVAKGVCSASEYRQCTADALTSCTSAQLCERGTCYYVNVGTGSGSTCSWASPCASFSALTSGGSISMGADTAIYLMGSTNLTVPTAHTPDGGDGTSWTGFTTEAAGTSSGSPNIIARYPTSTAKIDFSGASYCDGSPSDTADTCVTFKLQHDNWIVRGFEALNTYGGAAVWSSAGANHEVLDNYLHDMKCEEDNNCSGIKGHSAINGWRVHHNFVENIYDPETTELNNGSCSTPDNCDRGNVQLIRFFGDDAENNYVYNNFVGFNHVYGTTPYYVMGGGMDKKHGNNPVGFTTPNKFYNNVIWNVENNGILSNGAKDYIYGNIAQGVAGACYGTVDRGGGDGYFIDDVRIYDNTCQTIDYGTTQAAVSLNNTLTTDPTTEASISHNVIYDNNATCDGSENSIVRAFYYEDSGTRSAVIGGDKLVFDTNHYYNPNVASGTNCFSAFGNIDGLKSFATWISTYGFDSSGTYTSFSFNSSMQGSGDAAGEGWERQWPGATSTTTTTTTSASTTTTSVLVTGEFRMRERAR